MPRIGAFLLLTSAIHAQSVSGTLTDSVSHVPIPGVIVTLLGPARYNDTTDEVGAFHIGPVQPGRYLLNTVKSGYILPPARRASFAVDADMRLSVEMDPLSLVEGRVRYPDGRPASRATVWLNGQSIGAERIVTTDIEGHFAFDYVKPGEYILRAAAADGPRVEGEIWAATYFPSSIDRAAAETIRVVTAAVATRDIRLRSVPARHIGGVVRDESGHPAKGVRVTLTSSAVEEQQAALTGEDGVFDFQAREGEWGISASRTDGNIERRGSRNLTVSGHDVAKVEIHLALPFSIPVIVERDDPPSAGGQALPSVVFLSPVDGGSSLIPPAGDVLQNVYPGRYLIQASNGVPGDYVESIKLGESEVYGRPVEVWDGSPPIRITYKHGAPVVSGTVENGEGATVSIINASESIVGEAVRMVLAGRGGHFEFGDLRPGDYYLFALERNDPVMAKPAFRRAVVPRAEKIHLERGGTVILNLKIIPWPE